MPDQEDILLFEALRSRNLKNLRTSVAAGSRATAQEESNTPTALMEAARLGWAAGVTCLLAAADAWDIEFQLKDARTAVSFAIESDNPRVLRILIRAGADVENRGHPEITYLQRAVQAKNIANMRTLCRAGIDVNQQNKYSLTPLIMAVEEDFPEGVRELILLGAKTNIKASYGRSPLIAAVQSNSLSCLDILLRAGADINAVDSKGWSPIFWAAANGKKESFIFLWEAGATIDMKDKEGRTIDQIVDTSGCQQVLQSIRDQEALRTGSVQETSSASTVRRRFL